MIDWNVLFNMGFPAGITTYLIVRGEKAILGLTLAIKSLETTVQSHILNQ